MITKEQVVEACRQVNDPEITLDIYTLGLIYDVTVEDGKSIHITMTYTTPLCPFGERMKNELTQELEKLDPESIHIEVTFTPKWEATDELRELLGV